MDRITKAINYNSCFFIGIKEGGGNSTPRKRKVREMKLYKLLVNSERDIIHYDILSIISRKNEILKQWRHANEFGFSFWTNRPRPTFEIIINK